MSNVVEEDEPFVQILHNMGIENFNPLVPTALNEYATRKFRILMSFARISLSGSFAPPSSTGFATEILIDARDYSKHAGRAVSRSIYRLVPFVSLSSHASIECRLDASSLVPQEIEPEDVKLAVKLSDAHAVGFDAPESVQHAVREQMHEDLTELADPHSVLHRYPQDMFMQRAYTYITGSEAYPQVRGQRAEGKFLCICAPIHACILSYICFLSYIECDTPSRLKVFCLKPLYSHHPETHRDAGHGGHDGSGWRYDDGRSSSRCVGLWSWSIPVRDYHVDEVSNHRPDR
jgi:hypothetical protein